MLQIQFVQQRWSERLAATSVWSYNAIFSTWDRGIGMSLFIISKWSIYLPNNYIHAHCNGHGTVRGCLSVCPIRAPATYSSLCLWKWHIDMLYAQAMSEGGLVAAREIKYAYLYFLYDSLCCCSWILRPLKQNCNLKTRIYRLLSEFCLSICSTQARHN